MNREGDLAAIPDTWHLSPIPYIVMLAMPWYFTPNAGCLSLSNDIHNGQQVNGLGGFTCCSRTRHQEGPAHQMSPF